MVARATAQMLSDKWGQNVVVDSRPGGGGVIASETAARANPDGHTLYQNGFGLLLQGALNRVKFDVLKTFEPIVRSTSQPYILLAHQSLPAKSIKELIALSANKPLTYAGSAGIGSTVHLGMERFSKISSMKVKYIPYKGSAPSILALMGGEINMAAASAMASIAAMKTGKVRGLATLGLTRIPVLPDLPTLAEQGYPGFAITNSYYLWAPAKTPRPIVAAVNRVVSDGMHSPEMSKQLAASGSQPGERMTLEKLKSVVAGEYAEIVTTAKDLKL
jgi:tripartite-type tricarboxylate transporter receptor subunit TctC